MTVILRLPKAKRHNKRGNCWDDAVVRSCRRCGTDSTCDVCHRHDEPRGDCSDCRRCEACDDPPASTHDPLRCRDDACDECVNDGGAP